MIPDEYYIEIFTGMETRLTGFGWFNIPADRPDRDKLISAIKKRIDMYGDFVFDTDYSRFKRIVPFSEFYKSLSNPGGISYKIECYSSEEINIDYSHLPPPVFTPANKQIKRRQ